MDVGPPLSIPEGGTLYGSVTAALGAGSYVASGVPVCGSLPDSLCGSLARTV